VIAHVGVLPVEEILPSLAGVLVLARTWISARPRRSEAA
jgi:hypothetical protein